MIFSLHGSTLIYTNHLVGVGMHFYAPMMCIFHIQWRSFKVGWIVDDGDTLRLTYLIVVNGCDGRMLVDPRIGV